MGLPIREFSQESQQRRIPRFSIGGGLSDSGSGSDMMVLYSLVVSASAGGAALLIYAGLRHAIRPELLTQALIVHGALPRRLVGSGHAARAWGFVEASLGGFVSWALVAHYPRAGAVPLAVQAVLYAGYASYVFYALSRGGNAPCGCISSSELLNAATMIRAAALAAASGVAAAFQALAEPPQVPAIATVAGGLWTAGLALVVVQLWGMLPGPAMSESGMGRT